jgi:hypothetical protein
MSLEKVVLPGKRLGCKAKKIDSRTLKMAKYLASGLPPAPPSVDWTKSITVWGMMLNDQLGCCTIAGLGHAIQTWVSNASMPNADTLNVTDAEILKGYEDFDEYNPQDPSTDQGGIELDVLNDFKKQGFAGATLSSFVSVNVKNLAEVRQAIDLFGGVYIGVELPLSAQGQTIWDVIPTDPGESNLAGSWGGHCVWVPKYDETSFTCITWGAPQKITVEFWKAYVDEAYAMLSPQWIEAIPPVGRFDLATLQADIAQIG